MNKLNIKMAALVVSLAFSVGASAQSLSKTEYTAAKNQISSDYKTAWAACAAASGNARDICHAQASGAEKVATADLQASHKPGPQTEYQALVARAEAGYKVANERCDDLAGNAKDVCVQEARAAETTAKANAKLQLKTSEAIVTANEKTAEARSKATTQIIDARQDAAVEKVDARYAVAKEKCDAMAGPTKDDCLAQAKSSAGK